MPASTTRLALPYPVATDPADIPADMLALANKLDPAAAVFLQGTVAGRPAAGVQGRFYYATDGGVLFYDTGGAWATIGGGAAPGAPPLVTSLPGSPGDGQEVYYLADDTNGVVWYLRYRAAAAGAYKWELLGGSPLSAEVLTSESTSSTSYVALATAGPNLTAPLAGDYMLSIGFAGNIINSTAVMSYQVGATAAADADWAITGITTAGVAINLSTMRTRRRNAVAAATVFSARYRTSSASATFANRWMTLLPVRVG